jgi:hypothetical protein
MPNNLEREKLRERIINEICNWFADDSYDYANLADAILAIPEIEALLGVKCPTCKGLKKVRVRSLKDNHETEVVNCSDCKGTGIQPIPPKSQEPTGPVRQRLGQLKKSHLKSSLTHFGMPAKPYSPEGCDWCWLIEQLENALAGPSASAPSCTCGGCEQLNFHYVDCPLYIPKKKAAQPAPLRCEHVSLFRTLKEKIGVRCVLAKGHPAVHSYNLAEQPTAAPATGPHYDREKNRDIDIDDGA